MLFQFQHLYYIICTAQIVGGGDVAASDCIGVLNGTPGRRKGREGSRGARVVANRLSWRAPISSVSKPAVTRFMSKSPDANPGDKVIRDRREEDIAE